MRTRCERLRSLRGLVAAIASILVATGVGHAQIVVEQTVNTSNASTTSVTTGNVTGVTDHLYLASISTKSYSDVSTVTGLGLTWTKAGEQCGGRNQTNTEVWWALGNATTGGVSVTISSTQAIVVTVSRLSGVDTTTPIGTVVQKNTNGVDGSCSGGTDTTSCSVAITTSVDDAMLFGAIGIRNRTPTPGSGFTQVDWLNVGSGGDVAGVVTEEKTVATAGASTMDATFGSTVDWGAVAIEIRPDSGGILADHDYGQQPDAFTVSGGETNAELFGFNLDPGGGSINVTQLVLSISDIVGLVNGDWGGVEIIEDTNGDGDIGAGETTSAGGAGSVNQAAGTITFSSSFNVTAATNYIVRADFASLSSGDTVTIGLDAADITAAESFSGSATSVSHTEASYLADVLLVVVDATSLNAQESAKQTLIAGWGYRVVPISASATQAAFDSAVATSDVAYISETITSTVLGSKLVDAPIGIVIGESALADEFGISSTYGTFNDSAVDVTDDTHYITETFGTGSLSIFGSSQPLKYASGTLGGFQTLAEQLASSNRSLVVMETGDTLTGIAPTTIDERVATGNDDAEQRIDDTMYLNSSDLELAVDGTTSDTVGMRFTGLTIPPGESITNAYIQFTVDETNSGACSLTIVGEDTDDAAQFSTSNNDISSRSTTTASVAWSPPDWNSVGAAGADQRTPDLSSIIQEIVDRGGWASGNDIVLIITGTGTRTAESYDGSTATAPLLHVEYGSSGVAAGRRVYLPWGGSGLDINDLTADGKTMFKRALEWGCGPVAHWKLDDGSGTTAVDSVGGHDGTLTGGTWASGKVDGGLEFDGTSDYVSIADDAAFHITDAITVAAWVYGDAWGAGSDVDVVLRKGEGNPNNWQFAIVDGKASLILDADDGSGVKGDTVLSTGQWYHVAGTWDGAKVRIYVDGVLDAAPADKTGSLNTDTRTVYLGGRPGSDRFDGVLDDVRLYNRALSAKEIAALAGPAIIADMLLVVGNPGSLTAQESARKTQFEAWGYDITLIDEADSQANFDAAVAANDVAYVPEDVISTTLGSKLLAAPIGVVIEESDSFDVFGLTAGDAIGETDDGLTILAFDHYITSPYAAGNLTICSSVQPMNKVTETVSDGGQVLADWPGGGSALIAVDAGGKLIDGTRAAGRRVFLPLADNLFDWNELNTDGLAIVRRSLRWSHALMAYWKLDEASGTTAADTLDDFDATLTNMDPGSDWIPGRVDGAIDFDGVNDHVITSATFSPPAAGTVSFWMSVPGSPSSHGRILGLADAWEVRHVSTTTVDSIPYALVFDLGFAGENDDFVTTTTVDVPHKWYHVAAVYDTGTGAYAVYLDGALHKSGTASLSVPGGGQLAIGTRAGSPDYFVGRIDDVRISDLGMGADEIATAYENGIIRVAGWKEVQPH